MASLSTFGLAAVWPTKQKLWTPSSLYLKFPALFWTEVELAVAQLLEAAEKPEKLGSDGWRSTSWGKAVASAMCAAFELACPHDRPRQMRAYALGLQALFANRDARDPAKAEEEVE